jgi:hypothetical protein
MDANERVAAEQTRATGRGGRGGKGRGQGNRRAAKHGPDSEPGNRVTGAGLRTAIEKSGRQCGGTPSERRARWLCAVQDQCASGHHPHGNREVP